MRGRMDKVLVGREQRQRVAYTKLRKQGIASADLNARAPALVTQFRGLDVILPVWRQ